MKPKIVVTGGAGFIGSHIVDLLVENGHNVIIVDNFSKGRIENVRPEARVYKCDIRSPRFHEIIRKEQPECVIHQAAQVDVQWSLQDPLYDAEINIAGSLNVLEACRLYGVRKIIYSSSAAVYGDPLCLPIDEKHPIMASSPYGISKHTVEHYLSLYYMLYGLEYTVLRYANVYGPRQDPYGEGGVVAIFIHRILSNRQCVIYGDGEQTRDFVYVEDVAKANQLALDKGNGAILNISSGIETSINGLLDILRDVTNVSVIAERAEPRPGDIARSVLSNAKAKEILGWTPAFDLRSGIQEAVVAATLEFEKGGAQLRDT